MPLVMCYPDQSLPDRPDTRNDPLPLPLQLPSLHGALLLLLVSRDFDRRALGLGLRLRAFRLGARAPAVRDERVDGGREREKVRPPKGAKG